MFSIPGCVSAVFYNRFSQTPAIQAIAAGVGCLSLGKRLLGNPDPSPAPSLMRKIGRKAVGVALIGAGFAGLYYGGEPLITASTDKLKSLFFFGQNPTPSTLKDYYEEFLSKIQYENRYRKVSENQPEVLYLAGSADADYNGAFHPDKVSSLYRCLDAVSNSTYKVIRHPLQICEEIQSASKTRPLQNLVLAGHGSFRSIRFSPTSIFTVFDQLPVNCFDGLASTARIFLDACRAGRSLSIPNLAEWISWISGKEVIAPSSSIDLTTCSISPEDGRLDIRLLGLDENPKMEMNEWEQFLYETTHIDYTNHFNTSASWAETALFSVKMAGATVLGAMTTWQSMRFGATVLQGTGAAAEWLVDRIAAPTKRVAERVGFYNPNAAHILYVATKGPAKVLHATGKVAHQVMDKLMQPVSNLGSSMFHKSMSAITNLGQTAYSKIRRS